VKNAPDGKWLTVCRKPVRYWQGGAFLFCQECLNRVQAGEPVLPCEPWDDEDAPPEERYAELFRVSRVLLNEGVAQEAQIIPSLVFAGRSWEMPCLEHVRDTFVEAGDYAAEWGKLKGRFRQAFNSLVPLRVVDGALIVWLKEAYVLAYAHPGTRLIEKIAIEVYRRSAKPDKVAGLYEECLLQHKIPCDTLEKMQDDEASSVSAEDEEASWLKRISVIERKEERLLDLHLEGDISTEQFRAKSAALQEVKEAATANLKVAQSRRARLEDFERDKEALLEYHTRLVPEDLDGLTPEQRRTLYRMMRLTVLATPDSELTAEWCCNESTTPLDNFRTRGR
jgi:hypothetical protein